MFTSGIFECLKIFLKIAKTLLKMHLKNACESIITIARRRKQIFY